MSGPGYTTGYDVLVPGWFANSRAAWYFRTRDGEALANVALAGATGGSSEDLGTPLDEGPLDLSMITPADRNGQGYPTNPDIGEQ